jgi:hypothetical protein
LSVLLHAASAPVPLRENGLRDSVKRGIVFLMVDKNLG